MITKIVNLKTDIYDTYIGRGSPYGNPFKIGKDGDRDEVIRKFRLYFTERLKDPSYVVLVLKLRNKRLGCYCAPLACHGDVFVEYLATVGD